MVTFEIRGIGEIFKIPVSWFKFDPKNMVHRTMYILNVEYTVISVVQYGNGDMTITLEKL